MLPALMVLDTGGGCFPPPLATGLALTGLIFDLFVSVFGLISGVIGCLCWGKALDGRCLSSVPFGCGGGLSLDTD